MTFEELFSSASAKLDFAELETIMVAQMQKTLKDTMIEAISGYRSTFRKSVEEKMQEMLGVASGRMNLESHADNISRLVSTVMHDQIKTTAQTHLKELMESITEQAPKTIKLSEIVRTVKDFHYGNNEKCTLLIEYGTFTCTRSGRNF